MRRRVRPKALHRVVRAVAEQTQEGIISVQAARHPARRRVEISMVAAMWIEDTDSRVGTAKHGNASHASLNRKHGNPAVDGEYACEPAPGE